MSPSQPHSRYMLGGGGGEGPEALVAILPTPARQRSRGHTDRPSAYAENMSSPAQAEIPPAEHVSPEADMTPGPAVSMLARDTNQAPAVANRSTPGKSLQPQPERCTNTADLTGIETGPVDICPIQDGTLTMAAMSRTRSINQHYRRLFRSSPAPLIIQENGNGLGGSDHKASRGPGGQEVLNPASPALNRPGPRDLRTKAIMQAMETSPTLRVYQTPP